MGLDAEQAADGERRLEPSAKIDLRLLRAYRQRGSREALDELVRRYIPVARGIAHRFAQSGPQVEDLFQVACVGLLRSIERFDLLGARALFPYAYPTMTGEVRRYLRDTGWALRVPRSQRERLQRIRATSRELTQRLGREPTEQEICDETGLSVDQVTEVRDLGRAFSTDSLDKPIATGDEEGARLADRLGSWDDRYDVVEDMAGLGPLLGALSPRDREILRLRFTEDLTQSEIGERLDISQMHVSRLLTRTLKRLRAGLAVAS